MLRLTFILIIASTFIYPSKLDSLKNLLKKEGRVSEALELKIKIGRYFINRDADSALHYYISAKKEAEKLGDSALARVYWRMGTANQRRGKYTKAVENFNTALDIAVEMEDSLFQADILANLGYLYMDSDDIERAGKKFYESKKIYSEFEDSDIKISFLTNFARYLEEIDKLDSAKLVRLKAIKLATKVNRINLASINYVNIANQHVRLGEMDSADKYFQLAIQTSEQSRSKKATAMINLNYSMLKGQQGEFGKSIFHAKKAVPFFKNTEPEGLSVSYHNLSLAYDSLKKYDSALYYARLKEVVDDSIEKFKMQARIAEIEASKESEIKDLKISRLEKIRQTQLYFNYALIFIAVLILIILTLVLLANRKRRKNLEHLTKVNKEIDQKNAELRKSESELKELNHTKDKFFSIIAHDLRNPVNSIDRGLEFLIKNKEMLDPEDINELILETSENAKNLNGLLENLLSWSRSQRGLITLEKDKFELDKLLEMVYELYKLPAKAKGVKLIQEKSNLVINSDKNLINNIVRNLVNNAVKFTPSGGEITISSKMQDSNLIITVKDTGVGIDQKKLKGLFDIEENNSTHGTKGEKGTGLGLVLCYEFAQELGGTIEVKSIIEIGSEFSLIIPYE